jgi:hypothetical protein
MIEEAIDATMASGVGSNIIGIIRFTPPTNTESGNSGGTGTDTGGTGATNGGTPTSGSVTGTTRQPGQWSTGPQTISGSYSLDQSGVLTLTLNSTAASSGGSASTSQNTENYTLLPAKQNSEFYGFRDKGSVKLHLIRQ